MCVRKIFITYKTPTQKFKSRKKTQEAYISHSMRNKINCVRSELESPNKWNNTLFDRIINILIKQSKSLLKSLLKVKKHVKNNKEIKSESRICITS